MKETKKEENPEIEANTSVTEEIFETKAVVIK